MKIVDILLLYKERRDYAPFFFWERDGGAAFKSCEPLPRKVGDYSVQVSSDFALIFRSYIPSILAEINLNVNFSWKRKNILS